ncbi:MAG: metallophosphoesterase [Bacillota bacterium]
MFVEPRMLQVKQYTVASPEIPAEVDNLKIVFIADVHHNDYLPLSYVEDMAARVNAMHPDIILMGGDYVGHEPEQITPVFGVLGKMSAPLGVYGVLGNHDHWTDAAMCREEARKNGIKLIDNDMVWIEKDGARIALAGVGDLDEDVPDVSRVEKETAEEDYVILLSHNPDYIEQMPTDKVDLMLSGHTHGGQVTFLGLFAPVMPSRTGGKYRTGLYQKDGTTLIISNGIGVSVLPIRFCAPPQIVEITLKRG